MSNQISVEVCCNQTLELGNIPADDASASRLLELRLQGGNPGPYRVSYENARVKEQLSICCRAGGAEDHLTLKLCNVSCGAFSLESHLSGSLTVDLNGARIDGILRVKIKQPCRRVSIDLTGGIVKGQIQLVGEGPHSAGVSEGDPSGQSRGVAVGALQLRASACDAGGLLFIRDLQVEEGSASTDSKPNKTESCIDFDFGRSERVHIEGVFGALRVSLKHACVARQLEIRNSRLAQLELSYCRSGQVAITDLKVVGKIEAYRFVAEEVKAEKLCVGAKVDLIGLQLGGDLDVRVGCMFSGDVSLENASIGGSLNLGSASFLGNLNLDGAIVARHAFEAPPQQNLDSCIPSVSGRVSANRARIANLALRVATRGGGVVPTQVHLRGASVGNLHLEGPLTKLGSCLQTDGLDFQELKVKDSSSGTASSGGPTGFGPHAVMVAWVRLCGWSVLYLASAFFALSSSSFWVLLLLLVFGCFTLFARTRRRAAWPNGSQAPGGQQSVGRESCEASTCIDQGDSKAGDVLAFCDMIAADTTKRVEDMLRSRGNDQLADEVFLLRRRAGRKGGLLSPKAAWNFVLDVSCGFGVNAKPLLHLFILLFLLNWAVFSDSQAIAASTGREALHISKMNSGRGDNPAAELPSAFFVALQLQVPLVGLIHESDWEPSSVRVDCSQRIGFLRSCSLPISYREWGSVMKVLNTVLLPLLIAALSGLLKRPA